MQTSLGKHSRVTFLQSVFIFTLLFGFLGACKNRRFNSQPLSAADPAGYVTWTLNINLPGTANSQNLQCWYYYENSLSWFKNTHAANMQQLLRDIASVTPNEILFVNERPIPAQVIEESAEMLGEVVAEAYKVHLANRGKEVNSAVLQNRLLLRAIELAEQHWNGDAGFACPSGQNLAMGLAASERSLPPEEFKLRFRSDTSIGADGKPVRADGVANETSLNLAGVNAGKALLGFCKNLCDDAGRLLGGAFSGVLKQGAKWNPAKLISPTLREKVKLLAYNARSKAANAVRGGKGNIIDAEIISFKPNNVGAKEVGAEVIDLSLQLRQPPVALNPGLKQLALPATGSSGAAEKIRSGQQAAGLLAGSKEILDDVPMQVGTGILQSSQKLLPQGNAPAAQGAASISNSGALAKLENLSSELLLNSRLPVTTGASSLPLANGGGVLVRKSVTFQPKPNGIIEELGQGYVPGNGVGAAGAQGAGSRGAQVYRFKTRRNTSATQGQGAGVQPSGATFSADDFKVAADKSTKPFESIVEEVLEQKLGQQDSSNKSSSWLRNRLKRKKQPDTAVSNSQSTEPVPLSNNPQLSDEAQRLAQKPESVEKALGAQEVGASPSAAQPEALPPKTLLGRTLNFGKSVASFAAWMILPNVAMQMIPGLGNQSGQQGNSQPEVSLSSSEETPWLNASAAQNSLTAASAQDMENLKKSLEQVSASVGMQLSLVQDNGTAQQRDILARALVEQVGMCFPKAICVSSVVSKADLAPCLARDCNDPALVK